MPGAEAGRRISPFPYLKINSLLLHGTLLILPPTAVPRELRRLQFNLPGAKGGTGAYALAHLDPTDFAVVYGIRQFSLDVRHGNSTPLTAHQMVAWLQNQVADGQLAAIWVEGTGYSPPARTAPIAPTAGDFSANMSVGQKIIALFKAVPPHLPAALRAEFLAFISPKNLATMAGILVLLAVSQAAGVGEAVDALLMAIAWAMTGWAGLMAAAHFIDAIVTAGGAKTQADIERAAKEAADALIALGVTAFLAKLLVKAERTSATPKPEPETAPPPPPSPARGSTDDMMQRYGSRDGGLSYPRGKFKTDTNFDPANPTPDQQMALKQLAKQSGTDGEPAWGEKKIQEIVESGSNFTTKSFSPGDSIYKIGNTDLNTTTPSPYMLDRSGMDQLVNKGYVNQDLQVVDSAGIKQQLALPCYNSASNIFPGTVTESTTGVVSKINSASELFSLKDNAGNVVEGQIFMTGGGSQTALPPSAVSFGH